MSFNALWRGKGHNFMPLTRKIPCAISKIIKHSKDVFTLTLVPEKLLPQYKPGQFLHLAIDEYNPSGFWPESHVFSIANDSSDQSQINISYSVKGQFTARMANELFEGARVWIKLPYGEFVIENDQDIVLIAGGTGITAFTAFLESLATDDPRDIQLFYGAYDESLLIYEEMISRIALSFSGLKVHYYLEHMILQKEPGGQIYNQGRLSISEIWNTLSAPGNYVYYLSGPPEMLKLFSIQLFERGIEKENVRIDAWE
jgi:ferredoxin-NADP reductase